MKVPEGYVCDVFQEYGLQSQRDKVWTTKPLPLSSSRKLYSKAAKHATSSIHKTAVMAKEISAATSHASDILKKIVVASNNATVV